ncbi:MAG TPA: hypothetical protein VJB08_00240 [Candidatus Nanoarchaeia archaeon]|nr:hypothetical protein [Candidatus Nanoarchaeia archaeon]
MKFGYDMQTREPGELNLLPLDYLLRQRDRPVEKDSPFRQEHSEDSGYFAPHLDYMVQRLLLIQDHTMKALRKKSRFEPPSRTPGFYGRTWLGWDEMEIRTGLEPSFSHEVQTHESIHTTDEHETRQLTAWMLEVSFKYAWGNRNRMINYDERY